jgi:His-Xaa-Ser system radical SAM maturase HxsB
LAAAEMAADDLGFFRWGRIAGKVLVTNDAAEWAFLNDAEFTALLRGEITDGHPRFDELLAKGLLRDGLDLDALAARVAARSRHVRRGPYVHVVTLTSRVAGANGHAGDAAVDMTAETAEQVVELALQGPSPAMTFEFRGDGGEPLLNFGTLQRFVELAQSRNRQTIGKQLRFIVATDLTAMTDEIAQWLIANDVAVSTHLDGPATVHDANRAQTGGSAHADSVRWIEFFNKRYVELGRDPQQTHVDVRLRVTRGTIDSAKAVVDEYVARGLRTIHLHPLDSVRFDAETWAAIGYGAEQYLEFYRATLDYIVELNRRGVELAEGMATIFLTKMLTTEDPGIVDIQSPYGAGTGQLAYSVDGRVFPCEEARVIDTRGESTFELGQVRDLAVAEIVRHPTVRAIAAASLLDAQPLCAECWNKPYCGFSPVRSFATQGDLFGQRLRCFECKEHMAVARRLFELLADESDTQVAEIFKRWTVVRPPHAIDRRAAE